MITIITKEKRTTTDGITVIDTEENIRAYNLFCKIPTSSTESDEGGARHKAYDYLKNLPPEQRMNYIALYFQSQEGTVKFYEFSDSPKAEGISFNPLIMNGGTNNPFYKLVKSYFDNSKSLKSSEDQIDDLFEYIDYTQIN